MDAVGNTKSESRNSKQIRNPNAAANVKKVKLENECQRRSKLAEARKSKGTVV
jgi:hypothetical protein